MAVNPEEAMKETFPMLHRMSFDGRRIFSSEVINGNVVLIEACDLYYSERLTPDETRTLAEELRKLADMAESGEQWDGF